MEKLSYQTLAENGYQGYLLQNAPERVLDFYREHANDDAKTFAHAVVNNEQMWGGELKALPGFEEAVAAALTRIDEIGMYEAFKACL